MNPATPAPMVTPPMVCSVLKVCASPGVSAGMMTGINTRPRPTPTAAALTGSSSLLPCSGVASHERRTCSFCPRSSLMVSR